MSAAEEASKRLAELREDARQLDKDIIKCQENLNSLYIAHHAIQAQIHQLQRELG